MLTSWPNNDIIPMKKVFIILFCTYGFLFNSSSQESVYDSFDKYGLVNWIFFDNNEGGNLSVKEPNPYKDDINPSNLVAKFTKAENTGAVAYFFMEKPFDLSANTSFSFLISGDSGTTVSVKLQHNDLNNMAHLTETVKTYTLQSDSSWEKAEFDFSESSSRTDLDKFVLEMSGDGAGTFYFDDLTGPAYHDTAEILFCRTSFDGKEIYVKCNKFMSIVPDPEGLTLNINQIPVNLATVSIVDTFAKVITLIPEDTILPGDELSLSYTKGNVISKEGWPLREYRDFYIANATGKDTILVWSDEFNDEQLDTSVWTRLAGEYWFNNELQAYTNSVANSYCEDGKLKITAIKEKYGVREYTSARIVSRYHGDFRYGRFEARIKMPEGKGIWPAFWMMPTEDTYGQWPSSGEIDIMEFIGDQRSMNFGAIHYGDGHGDLHEAQGGNHYDVKNKRNADFNVYALEWKPDTFYWYFNNTLFHRAFASKASYHWPFIQDFHFIINLAIGGNWPGSPDETTVFPQTLEVDYVRVYKYQKDNIPDNTTKVQDQNNSANVFPNPVKSGQCLNFDLNLEANSQFRIYQPDGKLVMEREIPKNSKSIFIPDLSEGIYFINIASAYKNITSKIIVRKQ